MFSKLLNFLVDEMILDKRHSYSKVSPEINYNNPLIYADRPKKTHTEYAKHMTKKMKNLRTKNILPSRSISPLRNLTGLTGDNNRMALILFLLFSASVSFFLFRHQFFILLFIVIGAVSRVTQKYFPLIIGLDFCLFFAIIVTIAYSPILGMLTGVVSSILGSFFRQIERVEYYFTPIYGFIPVWLIMSLSIIPQASILLTGMLCVSIYIIARFIMIALTYNICIANQITYISTTLIFNYWLLSTIAPSLIRIMA